MNHGKKKMIPALLVGLAATVTVLLLPSTPNTQAAALTVNRTADSGDGILPSAAPRPSASGSSLCATTDFTYPLTITLAISDTFGPRLLRPSGYSRYDFHRCIKQNNSQQVTAGFYRTYWDTYVSAETGDDHPGCGTQSDPCASISYGIGQADAGGIIHVAEGTYTENLTLTKTVDLLASYPVVGGNAVDWATRYTRAYSTTVDGSGNGAVLTIDGGYGLLVEGFTFINGHRDGGGGGVRLVGGAAPTLRSNWILNNTAEKSGGGIYVGPYGMLPPTIISNTISGNTSRSSEGGGGGIYVKDRPALIQSNVISANQATANDGGGIYLTGDTTAQVLGNRILGNEAADDGGGVLVRSSGVYLVNNLIRDNTAGDDGSGIRVAGYSTPCIYHNTLVANHPESGVGLYIGQDSTPTAINNIIANHEVGVHCSSPVTVSSSVLSNTTNLDGDCIDDSSNIPADTRLCDEVHLCPDSPAIDAGENVGVDDDIDGEPRLAGDGYDIGADEFPAALAVAKHADPALVRDGEPLTDTLYVTNTGTVDLHATVTDTLPAPVMYTGPLVWTPTITTPAGVWEQTFVVTVETGYTGTLINRVQVTTDEGATGTARATVCANFCTTYLPLILRNWP